MFKLSAGCWDDRWVREQVVGAVHAAAGARIRCLCLPVGSCIDDCFHSRPAILTTCLSFSLPLPNTITPPRYEIREWSNVVCGRKGGLAERILDAHSWLASQGGGDPGSG